MALYTPLPLEEAKTLASRFGKSATAVHGIRGGSVNSNYRLELEGGGDAFVRIYEEQDLAGAARDVALARKLAEASVPTPAPFLLPDGTGVVSHRGKPAALVPWVSGEMRCQASVGPEDLHQVGAALARLHTAKLPEASPNRFGADALLERCDRIAAHPDAVLSSWADPLRAWIREVDKRRVTALPRGVIHGDVFRDNVLFSGPTLTALLDFESASEGPFAFDLAVTLLAWCFGDDFDRRLGRALVAGYQTIRPLEEAERQGLFYEAHFGTLRFATTRITDYAMRAGDGTNVTKDYRRFLFRMGRLRKLGPRGFRSALGLLACGSALGRGPLSPLRGARRTLRGAAFGRCPDASPGGALKRRPRHPRLFSLRKRNLAWGVPGGRRLSAPRLGHAGSRGGLGGRRLSAPRLVNREASASKRRKGERGEPRALRAD